MSEVKIPSVTLVNVSDLIPYEFNARIHSDAQVKQIADSIERLKFRGSITIEEDGTIVAGHGRVLAAKLLGIKQLPAIIEEFDSPEERGAYILADNSIGLNAEWDQLILLHEFDSFEDFDFDLSILGFEGVDAIDMVENSQPTNIPTFKPVIEPTKNTKDITDGDVAGADANLKEKYDFKESEEIELICPHCEEVYIIRKDSLT